VFEEEIIFATTTSDDDPELLSETTYTNDKLCVSFSTSMFPHHHMDSIPEFLQKSTLQDVVLHGFMSPFSQFVAGKGSTLLPDCFHQVSKLIHLEHNPKH